MSTDTPTTEQEQWVLAYDDGKLMMLSLKHLRIVRVDLARGYARTDNDIRTALSDPANVLLVEAYPEVVEALKREVERCHGCEGSGTVYGPDEHSGMTVGTRCPECDESREMLSAVHPAEGGKT